MSEILSLKEWVARKGLLKLDVRPFVDGHYVDSASTGRVEKIDPSNGKVLYTFCEGSEADVREPEVRFDGFGEDDSIHRGRIVNPSLLFQQLVDRI